jgi:RNA-binding protein YhbY
MKSLIPKFQIGKAGITSGFIDSLELALKKHKLLKIHILKSAGHEKEKIKEFASKLQEHLKVKTKIIGFVIVLRRRKK